jgi:tetratricopeptide (TPR) repeat protein
MAAQHDSHLTLDDVFWLMYHHEVPGVGKLKLIRCRLESCAECRTACPGLLELMDSGQLPEDLGFYDLHLFYSAQEAGKVWATLEGSGPELLRRRLQVEPATYGLVALLAEEAHQQASIDVDRALLLAEAALEMAHRLKVLPQRTVDGFDYRCLEAEARTEMLGWCHGVLANAQRKHLQYLEAERNFQKALALLEEVDSSLFLGKARVLSMRASLLIDNRLLDEAIDCLADARWALHDAHPNAGRLGAEIAIVHSIALGAAGRHASAVAVAVAAQEEGGDCLPTRLRFALAYQAAMERLATGDWAVARDDLPQVKELLREGGRLADGLRVRWLEERIRAAEGDLKTALGGFRDLQRQFLEEKMLHEAGSLALEIAGVLLALDRPEETVSHAREALAVFAPLQVKDEMVAALTFLVQGATSGALTQEVVNTLLRYAQGGHPPKREAWTW